MRMTNSFFACILLTCIAAGGERALAWDSPAPDVVLYCTPAMQAPLREVAALYTAANGVAVHILVGSPDGQAGLIAHRARADVLVAEAPVIERLDAEHLIRPGSIVSLGADGFVLISQAGARVPTGATPAQLVAAHTIVLPDPTSAGSFDGAAVLRASLTAGASSANRPLADGARANDPPATETPRIMGVADTPTVIALVQNDATLLGVVNRTEVGRTEVGRGEVGRGEFGRAGIETAAALPAAAIGIDGALLSNGQSRNAAALLAFIAGPRGRAVLGASGLEMKS
jgi:ABC-type molybdate transport system substrate-binding protein